MAKEAPKVRYFSRGSVQEEIKRLSKERAILCGVCRGKYKNTDPVPIVVLREGENGLYTIRRVYHKMIDENNPHKRPCNAAGYLMGHITINSDRVIFGVVTNKEAVRYTIRVRHKLDKPSRWLSAGWAMYLGTPEGLKDALKSVEMMNSHPGNPGGLWAYKIFEYHGKRDYRPLGAK